MLSTLNFWLWVAQAFLALAYLAAGAMKAFRPIEALAPRMTFVKHYSVAVVRFIGWAEIAGAIGLILPMVTGILPWLTPVAAIALGIVQVLAINYHIRHNEIGTVPANLVLLALSAFIAWGRWDLLA